MGLTSSMSQPAAGLFLLPRHTRVSPHRSIPPWPFPNCHWLQPHSTSPCNSCQVFWGICAVLKNFRVFPLRAVGLVHPLPDAAAGGAQGQCWAAGHMLVGSMGGGYRQGWISALFSAAAGGRKWGCLLVRSAVRFPVNIFCFLFKSQATVGAFPQRESKKRGLLFSCKWKHSHFCFTMSFH